MSVVLNATWRVEPGAEETVRAALAKLAPLSRAEPGNSGYTVYASDDEPGVFRIFEVYADDEATAAHTASAHFQHWGIGVAIPLLVERKREFYRTIDV